MNVDGAQLGTTVEEESNDDVQESCSSDAEDSSNQNVRDVQSVSVIPTAVRPSDRDGAGHEDKSSRKRNSKTRLSTSSSNITVDEARKLI